MSVLSFTNKYNNIETIQINNAQYSIVMHDSSRWICKFEKENISYKGDFDITLYDNYGEIYKMKYINNSLTYDVYKINIIEHMILLHPRDALLYQMPDIAIDVLKTINHPVGVETLYRLSREIHTKDLTNLSNSLEKMSL